jgi:hypothetical protein
VINYDGRRFRKVTTDPAGAPIARYHQDGDVVWAESSGGEVRRGAVVGTCAVDGVITIAYSMALTGGRVISGRCVSTPEVLADGRIRLHEEWERFAPHADSGVSVLEELPPDPEPEGTQP